jgi:hypothetical protein
LDEKNRFRVDVRRQAGKARRRLEAGRLGGADFFNCAAFLSTPRRKAGLP